MRDALHGLRTKIWFEAGPAPPDLQGNEFMLDETDAEVSAQRCSTSVLTQCLRRSRRRWLRSVSTLATPARHARLCAKLGQWHLHANALRSSARALLATTPLSPKRPP